MILYYTFFYFEAQRKQMSDLECQPLIQKFVNMFEIFLESMHLPHYSEFQKIKQDGNTAYFNYITECCSDFVEVYMKCNVSHNQKFRMVEEYGMKKLIDLQVSYDGNSICLELLHFSEHIDKWVHILLMNVINAL